MLVEDLGHMEQLARPVLQADAQAGKATLAGQFAQQHVGEQARVDVAAADDKADVLATERRGIGHEGGKTRRARAFGHRLFDGEQQGDGALKFGFRHQNDVIDQRLDHLIGVLAGVLHGNALGEGVAVADRLKALHLGRHGRVKLGLYADDLDIRLDRAGRRCDARNEPAAADGDDEAVQLRRGFQHFQRNGALPGHHQRIVERVNEHQSFFLRHLLGQGGRFLQLLAVQDDARAVACGLLHLHCRRAAGHDDGGRNAETGGVVGHALRMVACGHRNDAALALLFGQVEQAVQRAALLERGGELEVLELEPDVRAEDLAEGAALEARRINQRIGNGGPGLQNLFRSDGQGGGVAADWLSLGHGHCYAPVRECD